MATRNKLVFITPEEFVQWVPEIAETLGASLVLWDFAVPHPIHWDGTSESLLRAYCVYFAEEKQDLSGLIANDVAPAEQGWFQVDVPKVEGNALLLISLGVKSSWEGFDNPSVIKFFDKFWRQWKKHFRYGVIAKNIKFGGEGPMKDLGYSPGVVGWCAKGGELRQWGSKNMAFFLPPSAESSE